MNKYIIYTPEGYCEAPDGGEICNCQVLGMVQGESEKDAIDNLLKDNEWIVSHEYDRKEFIVKLLHPSESV